MKSFVLLYIIFFVLQFHVLAQQELTIKDSALNTILDLNFEQYNYIKQEYLYGNEILFTGLDAYKTFISYKISTGLVNTDSVIDILESATDKIESSKEMLSNKLIALADINFMLSYLNFESNNYFFALHYYYKAKNYTSALKNETSDSVEYLKYDLIVTTINYLFNEQLPWNNSSANIYRKQFINLVSKGINKGSNVQKRELKIVAGVLFGFYVNADIDVFVKIMKFDTNYAHIGPIESAISSLWLRKNGDYIQAEKVLAKAYSEGMQQKLHLLELWYGVALLDNIDSSSIAILNSYIDNSNNIKYVNYARFKVSMYWFVMDNKQASEKLNAKIKKSGYFLTKEDKQALYEINNSEYWLKGLLKARLLFDGGNFEQALNSLFRVDSLKYSIKKEQLAELWYRKARIYHKTNSYDSAVVYYNKVIYSGVEDRFYYPVYSLFYMGNIYEKRGSPQEAKKYYSECISTKSPVYEYSIHYKAKVAIENLVFSK